MAARNTVVAIPAETWTQLTDNDVSALTFKVESGGPVHVLAQNGDTTPTSDPNLQPMYPQNTGEASDRTLAVLYPGVTTPNRVFAWSRVPSRVWVSHAA